MNTTSGMGDTEATKVVAIGASAGGIQALSRIIATLPSSFNAALVIVLHQAPGRESLLPTVLQRAAKFPVMGATAGDFLRSGKAYVVPGGYHCDFNEDHSIRLFQDGKMDHSRPSLIPTFESVAKRFGKNSMVVVLTGYGRNGAAALVNAKSFGAEILAQDPAEAQASGMPRAAIATGAVDQVLKLDDIAQEIKKFCG